MSTCTTSSHCDHAQRHGPGCGHPAVRHGGHIDYLHDGHLHHPHDDHVDEHVIEVSGGNPDTCTTEHRCGGHQAGHVHGPDCGHETVQRGDHIDYSVTDHLPLQHGDHCDYHSS